jgi:hypothetical protein
MVLLKKTWLQVCQKSFQNEDGDDEIRIAL